MPARDRPRTACPQRVYGPVRPDKSGMPRVALVSVGGEASDQIAAMLHTSLAPRCHVQHMPLHQIAPKEMERVSIAVFVLECDPDGPEMRARKFARHAASLPHVGRLAVVAVAVSTCSFSAAALKPQVVQHAKQFERKLLGSNPQLQRACAVGYIDAGVSTDVEGSVETLARHIVPDNVDTSVALLHHSRAVLWRWTSRRLLALVTVVAAVGTALARGLVKRGTA